ncbi:Myotubularin-related protein 13 [Nymphon striatum]|nr:Myotubularin-related protein 13 [Nymphon striatum]
MNWVITTSSSSSSSSTPGSGLSFGKILQRFPEKDWNDTPFIEGIELFCQPQGWNLSTERQHPTFFVSVLTDIDANRHYCACLSFNEAIAITPSKQPDEEDMDIEAEAVNVIRPNNSTAVQSVNSTVHHSIMYAPKCLVLVSSLDYFSTFRNCLGVIYSVYVENMPVSMETLVGNILGCVQVPPAGGPQVRFSIGAGDRQALQPPLSNSLPCTNISVATLFQQLGIRNVITIFCAALTEHKILFHSQSYSRLTDGCHALTSLLYPLRYSHVYIPLLPAALIEVLNTPTPFIMGVHASLKNDVADLMDVVIADLDGGSIFIPECITLSLLPDPLYTHMHNALCMDKEIRAIFLRSFAQLLQGYRSCLNIVRIHPKPFITFHKAAFLGKRNMVDDDFMSKVLDCMFFNTFVAERGPPYRENPNPQPYVQKIPKPTEGAFTRIHQPTFPKINHAKVQDIINEGMTKYNLKARLQAMRPQQTRIVPVGPSIVALGDNKIVVGNSARRLEVLRNCINCIFDNKISDARKTFPAVLRALKNKSARLALTQELSFHVIGNKAMLDNQQFDLIVRLMNCALQDDSVMDEHGLAAALLPLATAFCRGTDSEEEDICALSENWMFTKSDRRWSRVNQEENEILTIVKNKKDHIGGSGCSPPSNVRGKLLSGHEIIIDHASPCVNDNCSSPADTPDGNESEDKRERISVYDNVPVVFFSKPSSIDKDDSELFEHLKVDDSVIDVDVSSEDVFTEEPSKYESLNVNQENSIIKQHERRDSGVGLSLSRPISAKRSSFDQISGHVSLDSLSAGQMMVLKKLSLLKLTALMERYSPSNRSGWSWAMPKFIKRIKSPDYKDKKVFGLPLLLVLQRTGQPLPKKIQSVIHSLRIVASESVGLFRKSGVRSRIQCLKNQTETRDDVNYENFQANDVADLLKQYFRELPEALLTNKLSETFISIFQYIPTEIRFEATQAAIFLMPDENREVLQTLLNFLYDVSQKASENQMTASNLAVCFAPSLFHMNVPRNSSNSPRRRKIVGIPDQKELKENKAAHECLTHMIADCQKLFSVSEDVIHQCRFSYSEHCNLVTTNHINKSNSETMSSWEKYVENCVSSLIKDTRPEKYLGNSKGWVPVSYPDNTTDLSYKKLGDGHHLKIWRITTEVEAPPVELLNKILRERTNFSDFQTGQIVGASPAGASVTEISPIVGATIGTVSKVMMVYTVEGKISSANHRSGRNSELDERDRSIFKDADIVPQTWDEHLDKWKIVQKVSRNTEIYQFGAKSMNSHPVCDFCVIRTWKTDMNRGGCALIEESINHPEAQISPDGVRGLVVTSRYFIEPCGSGKSRISHLSRIDMRGKSPEWYNRAYGHVVAIYLTKLRDSFKQGTDGPETKV